MNVEYYYNIMRQDAKEALAVATVDVDTRRCITEQAELIIPILQIRGFKISTRFGNIELSRQGIEWLKELQDFTKSQLEKE